MNKNSKMPTRCWRAQILTKKCVSSMVVQNAFGKYFSAVRLFHYCCFFGVNNFAIIRNRNRHLTSLCLYMKFLSKLWILQIFLCNIYAKQLLSISSDGGHVCQVIPKNKLHSLFLWTTSSSRPDCLAFFEHKVIGSLTDWGHVRLFGSPGIKKKDEVRECKGVQRQILKTCPLRIYTSKARTQ